MEMYKHPRSESDVIRRLQKLGFCGTMAYPDGFFQMVKHDGSSTIMGRKVQQRMSVEN